MRYLKLVMAAAATLSIAFFATAPQAQDDPGPAAYAQALKGKRVMLVPLAMGFDLAQGWSHYIKKEVEAFGSADGGNIDADLGGVAGSDGGFDLRRQFRIDGGGQHEGLGGSFRHRGSLWSEEIFRNSNHLRLQGKPCFAHRSRLARGETRNWRTRRDSNPWPLPSEGSALSS